jgi:DNA repair protein RecO (recombination protein O)
MTIHDGFVAGYVLHARPYQETSALVETFCRDAGRVSMVFRRVRGGKQSKTGWLQPFQPVWLHYTGQHELRNGRQVESRGAAVWLTGTRLYSGLYLNELLVRVLRRDDPHPELFDAYERALTALGGEDLEPVLRCFESELLAAIGYGVALDATAEGEPLNPSVWYRLDRTEGLVVSAVEGGARAFLGAWLLAMAAGDWRDTEVRQAAKRFHRQALEPHLGDRPLMSRSLFASHKHHD